MTGLTKWTSKDVDAIFDAANRYSVGFDDLFYRLHAYGIGSPQTQYPPYNIVKESDTTWRIELALAGWDRDQIEVATETNVITIRSVDKDDTDKQEYIHRGVAARTFARGFNLSDDVEVGDVSFNNGLLSVTLTKIVPDHQNRKLFNIL